MHFIKLLYYWNSLFTTRTEILFLTVVLWLFISAGFTRAQSTNSDSIGTPLEDPFYPFFKNRFNKKSFWIGNTYGGDYSPGGEGHVQLDMRDIDVFDGRLYTNSYWDERTKESGVYNAATGEPVTEITSGRPGGDVVAVNKKYVFLATRLRHRDPHLYGVSRYFRPRGKVKNSFHGQAVPAPFSGGKGPEKNLRVTKVGDKDAGRWNGQGPQGIAVSNGELFVSDSTADDDSKDRIIVYDTESMQQKRSISEKPEDCLCFNI